VGLLGPLPVMVTQKRGIRYSPFFIVVYLSSKDKKMAKVKSAGNSIKISFGKRKSKPNGQKSWGPKDQKPKKYIGQGR